MNLGDGAYATDLGYAILLTANHHDPEQATDRIYLEKPYVVENLLRFIEESKKPETTDDRI